MQICEVIMRLIVILNILLQIHGESLHKIKAKTNNDELLPEYNVYRTKLSKLRLILFGDILNENEIPPQQQLNIITCIANTSSLNVTTKNCPCENYSCKDSSPSTSTFNFINQRKIHTSCREYCCRKKKANRSISSNQIPVKTDRPNPRTICNKQPEKQISISNGQLIVPWLYRINLIEKGTTICAGALIYPNVILTTAVCVINKKSDELIVRTQSDGKEKDGIIVEKIILHQNFSTSFDKLQHNVALLVLEDKGKQDEISNGMESYICLSSILNYALASSYNVCRIYSWKEDPTDTLNGGFNYAKTNISIYNTSDCGKVHEKYINNGNICAGLPNYEDVNVDLSGSPLVCSAEENGEKFNTVQGLLTWSTDINRSPHLFTNIVEYQDWVYTEIENIN